MRTRAGLIGAAVLVLILAIFAGLAFRDWTPPGEAAAAAASPARARAPARPSRPSPRVYSSRSSAPAAHVMPSAPMPAAPPVVPWTGPTPASLEEIPPGALKRPMRGQGEIDVTNLKLRLLRALGSCPVGAGELVLDLQFAIDRVTHVAEPLDAITIMDSQMPDEAADLAVVECVRAALRAQPIRINFGADTPDGPWHWREDFVFPPRNDRLYAKLLEPVRGSAP